MTNEINRSLDNLFGGSEIKTLSRQRVEHELKRLAAVVETLDRDRFLLALKSTTEVAEMYDSSRQAINTRAARYRRKIGSFGYKGDGWLYTPAEVAMLEPDDPGRPPVTAT